MKILLPPGSRPLIHAATPIVCLIPAQTTALADDPAKQSPPDQVRMVEVEARFVRASEAQINKALKTAGAGDGESTILSAAQRGKVFESLQKGGADFFASPRTVTMNGQRADIASVREVRFPTEYEMAKDGSGKLVPTVFDMRNAGVIFAFQANIVAGGRINLILAPDVTTFLGFIDESSGKPGRDPHDPHALEDMLRQPLKEGDRWAPIFAIASIRTQVTIPSGQTMFLGSLPDAAPSDSAAGDIASAGGSRQIYLFVTARAILE